MWISKDYHQTPFLIRGKRIRLTFKTSVALGNSTPKFQSHFEIVAPGYFIRDKEWDNIFK